MLPPGLSCLVADEDAFGPIVNASCHHGFDFTLLFEETILTLLPLSILFVLWPFRVWKLYNSSEKVKLSWLYAAKGVWWLLTVLIVTTVDPFTSDNLFNSYISSIDSTSLFVSIVHSKNQSYNTNNSVASFACTYLSHLEHRFSVRPSTILCLFQGLTVLLDLSRLRTLSFIPNTPFAASWVVKAVILVLEATEKRSSLRKGFEKTAIEETSGVFSRTVFWWLNDLLWKGSNTTLTVDDLPILAEDLRVASDPQAIKEKWEKANKNGRNVLLWTLTCHYKWEYLVGVLPRLAYTGFAFAQPFLVQRVLDFMEEPEHVNSSNYAYGLIVAYAIVYIGIAATWSVYQHKTHRLRVMVRGSLVSLIFDKTLRLNTSAVSDATAVTLMSTDIERIQTSLVEMHEVYSNFIEIALALWFLARLLGIATIAATVIVLVCLAAAIPFAIATGNAQGKWLEAVEERVAVTSKVLGVMKNVKMTGLTDIVASILRNLRLGEISSSRPFRLLNVLNVTISYLSSALAPVFGFGVYILMARANDTKTLTNGIAFSALTLFMLLDVAVVSISDEAEDFMALVNCFQRIQSYLLETERTDHRSSIKSEEPNLIDLEPIDDSIHETSSCIKARDLSVAWSIDDEFVLNNLSFDLEFRKTTMIVGPVGCGKSTLLKTFLGEAAECTGSIAVAYKNAAYCSQSPWISFSTIQENIVGASAWDQKWYDRVIQACALQLDLQHLPSGDQTKVGVRGSRLSGGQQMRVALARALYSREPILILDDVLTGLDRETETFILESVFGQNGLLKEISRTVIMATNSAHHLPYADHIISINSSGQFAEQGSYEELVVSCGSVSFLPSQTGEEKTVRLPEVVFDEETLQELNLDRDEVDHTSRQTGDWLVYLYYFQNIGWPLLSLCLACSMLFIAGLIFPQLWLQWWSRANEQHPNEDIGYWLGGYAALAILTLIASFFANWVFGMVIIPKTARRFHDILLDTTMRATTSFLTSTDVGTTTNRFSQDLELIDDELPSALELAINSAISCIIEGFLVFAGASYLTATIIPFCALVIYYVARHYVRTSRQLRLLDMEAKAPLFSHFLESLGGLTSIRAYGWSEDYQRQSQLALDISQRAYYPRRCIQRWMNFALDLLVAVIAITVISVAFAMKGKSSSNLLGIALFNIVNFSVTLQSLVQEWTGLETSIGGVARIRSYVQQAKTEDLDSEVEVVSTAWPLNGDVEISNVSASYDGYPEPVLRDINLKISAGEKIALCGRTGSGKSSLISTILRTLEISNGTICIDGMDISKISRSHIRSSLNTIPQQAFFLSGSIRLNASPHGNVLDEVIIDALREVNLWSYLESKGGLDADMSEDLLSHGQQQLFCLARALCKSSKIVILDEATSSVDSETEKLMQHVIRTRFKDQTIIAIAHKLESILDFDKIAFLDQGKVVEFDTPQNLLSKEGSTFSSLYNSAQRVQI
ncbi:P-loop containing nucleoside triphosphate hydrolase protein [Penicillium malachiteum]|uniref:P-loop containing nucleoside triphosphate hydrolase protein n=1 Tax=Penicillium malachiteum TaxID=1324776 RepID=A0AAD6HW03_9EURO|nr:P-loop containing nucleoside triphosphate hydrolase protein [Penicillium malachiteum]